MEATATKVAALIDTVRTLDAIGLMHALIGGLAVGVHSGVPRATLDVDLACASDADRAQVVERLTRAGYRLVGEFPHSVNFRHASGEPVQLAFDPAFDAMLARAERFVVEGVSVPMRMCFDDLGDGERPQSGTAQFARLWVAETADEQLVAETVYRWRNQIR